MAKGHGVSPGYIPGDHWDTCDRCGFERRRSALREEWNGLTVCADTCWEPRHPQDFLRVREDGISAPDPGTQSRTDTVTTYATERAHAGEAIAGIAVAGHNFSGEIPVGTFNTNTL